MIKFEALLLVAALAVSCQSAEPRDAVLQPTGQIAFNRSGQVVLMDVTTRSERTLIEDNSFDRPLHWLPHGDRLVYWNHGRGAWDLWAIAPETMVSKNLTGTANDSRSANGSPDGRWIAFQRGGQGVWIMNADGSEPRKVHDRGHRDDAPAWSPSSRRIAFHDLEAAGEGRVRLVAWTVDLSSDPVASKSLGHGEVRFFLDDRHVVVASRHAGQHELVAVDVESGTRRPLTHSAASEENAIISRDRRQIAWIAHEGDVRRLEIMDTESQDVRELARVDRYFAPPSFSHDGRYLVFESGETTRNTEIFVVPVRGGVATQLTQGGASYPVWRPSK